MTTLLAAVSVILTAIYAALTYYILRANRATVAAMQQQAARDRKFRIREHFLSGIGAIAQYDIDSPGCEQAMRLLDYYSSLALIENEPELFYLLNTVMTAEIRKKIEEIQKQKREIYLNAVAARDRIQTMLRDHNLQRKGLKST